MPNDEEELTIDQKIDRILNEEVRDMLNQQASHTCSPKPVDAWDELTDQLKTALSAYSRELSQRHCDEELPVVEVQIQPPGPHLRLIRGGLA